MGRSLVAVLGPADLRDQRWLDEQIAAIDDGMESVVDIARNWTDGRNLARLHPGVSAQTYVMSHVKHALGRGVIEPLLAESNWSNRQIAAVAGVGRRTVDRVATGPSGPVRPAETLGADGKLRSARVIREVVAEVIEEEKPSVNRRSRATVTEVRQQVRILQGVLSMLRPDEVVPVAHALIREVTPALTAWVELWTQTEGRESE